MIFRKLTKKEWRSIDGVFSVSALDKCLWRRKSLLHILRSISFMFLAFRIIDTNKSKMLPQDCGKRVWLSLIQFLLVRKLLATSDILWAFWKRTINVFNIQLNIFIFHNACNVFVLWLTVVHTVSEVLLVFGCLDHTWQLENLGKGYFAWFFLFHLVVLIMVPTRVF